MLRLYNRYKKCPASLIKTMRRAHWIWYLGFYYTLILLIFREKKTRCHLFIVYFIVPISITLGSRCHTLFYINNSSFTILYALYKWKIITAYVLGKKIAWKYINVRMMLMMPLRKLYLLSCGNWRNLRYDQHNFEGLVKWNYEKKY